MSFTMGNGPTGSGQIGFLRRMSRRVTPSGLICRLVGPVGATVLAAVLELAHPGYAISRIALGVFALTLTSVVISREPVPTLVLVMLLIEYSVATRGLSGTDKALVLLGAVVLFDAIHAAYSLASAVRMTYVVENTAIRRVFSRLGRTLLVAVPVAAVVDRVGTGGPIPSALGFVAIAIALALTFAPLTIHRAR